MTSCPQTNIHSTQSYGTGEHSHSTQLTWFIFIVFWSFRRMWTNRPKCHLSRYRNRHTHTGYWMRWKGNRALTLRTILVPYTFILCITSMCQWAIYIADCLNIVRVYEPIHSVSTTKPSTDGIHSIFPLLQEKCQNQPLCLLRVSSNDGQRHWKLNATAVNSI